LKTRLEEFSEQNTARLEEIKRIKSRNTQLEQDIRTARVSKDDLQKQYNILIQAKRALEAQTQELQSSLSQREIKETQLQAAVTFLTNQKEQMSQLIEQRNEEVQAAKEFLNSQDKFSGAEIVSQVRALNEQIFQVRVGHSPKSA
jgi:chromosome segregation ATPase